MYKSPISIIESTMDSLYQTIIKQKDDAIFAEIQHSFGVDLDKDELIRALQYDRGQYEKGYADGKADAVQQWIPVSERLPNINESVLVCFDFMDGKCVRVSDRYGKNGMLWAGIPSNCKVTHWMPLPEPPKEG